MNGTRHKKHRTDILIEQHLEFISRLENEIKNRKKAHRKIFELNESNTLNDLVSARDFLHSDSGASSFNLENDEENGEQIADLGSLNDTHLYNVYKRNLIKHEIIKKLNRELGYARANLYALMRNQHRNLTKCRERVEWLENEIEKIILSNKSIKFPLQNSILNDESLKVRKEIFIYVETPDEKEASKTEIKEPVESTTADSSQKKSSGNVSLPEEEIIQLEFKWERKNSASTESLLQEDSDDEFLQTMLSPKAHRDENSVSDANKNISSAELESHLSPIKSDPSTKFEREKSALSDSNNTKASTQRTDHTNLLSEATDLNDKDTQKSVTIKFETDVSESVTPQKIDSIHSTSLRKSKSLKSAGASTKLSLSTNFALENLIEKSNDLSANSVNEEESIMNENISTRVEKNETAAQARGNLKSVAQNLLIPHRCYEHADYSKEMVALDNCSYHNLGIAITESYLNKNQTIRTGVRDVIARKSRQDEEDKDFMDLGDEAENFSKIICAKTSTLFRTKIRKTGTKTKRHKNTLNAIEQKESFENLDSESDESQKKTTKINVPKNLQKALKSRRMSYRPEPLLPVLHLPLPRRDKDQIIPRSPSLFASLSENVDEKKNIQLGKACTHRTFHPTQLVNQQNLKELTRLKLYSPPAEYSAPPSPNYGIAIPRKNDRDPPGVAWSELKSNSSPLFHSGPKFEKIKFLLSNSLKSSCFDERRDAIKHIGILKVGDHGAVHSLTKILHDADENELIRYEVAKTLVSLGEWSETACYLFAEHLKKGNQDLKIDILHTIANGKNAQFTDLTKPSIKNLVQELNEYLNHADANVALDACACLGKLGIKDCDAAIECLTRLYASFSNEWNKKALVLEILVKLFDYNTQDIVYDFIMNQIECSTYWIARSCAVKLLSYIGPAIVCRHKKFDSIYELLEKRLVNDPVKEVRLTIANTIKHLKIYDIFAQRMIKNLRHTDESIRLRAVVSLEMLNVQSQNVVNVMLDMLDLDTSSHVRGAVLKALMQLAPNNSKVKKMSITHTHLHEFTKRNSALSKDQTQNTIF